MRRDGLALLRYTSYRILTFAFIQRRYLGRRVLQSPFALNLTGTSHAQGAWNVSWPASNGSAGTLRKPWPYPARSLEGFRAGRESPRLRNPVVPQFVDALAGRRAPPMGKPERRGTKKFQDE